MTFKELQLNENILRALSNAKFEEPTEIQEKAIPVFLSSKNLFGKSSTGTGKTASFVLPILNNLKPNLRKPQAIIMAPTRELAMQIVGQIRLFGSKVPNLSIAPIIGGAQMRDQVKKLKESQIVVGTPGRVNDHLQRGTLNLKELNTIILDEADEMLKMGFKNEIDNLFEAVRDDIQVGLFSATNTPKVMQIANNYMNDYELIEIKNELKVNANITNTFIFTKGASKEELLLKVFEKHNPQRVIIFTNTKANTDRIAKNLSSINVRAAVINGDKRQSQRSKSINQFKNNEVKVLVATDVVARGIDVAGVDYVINYDISMDDENFVHRIGRTGRNNTTGDSITFVQNQNTLRQLRDIEKAYKITVNEIDLSEYGVEKTAGGSRDRGSRDRGSRDGRSRDGGRSRNNDSRNRRSRDENSGRNSERSFRSERSSNNERRTEKGSSNSWSKDSSWSNFGSKDNNSSRNGKSPKGKSNAETSYSKSKEHGFGSFDNRKKDKKKENNFDGDWGFKSSRRTSKSQKSRKNKY